MAEKKITTGEKVVKKATSVAKKTGVIVARNPLPFIYVGIGLVAIFVIVKIGKGISKAGDKLTGQDIVDNIEIGSKLSVDPVKTTITQENARVLASQLLTAMNWRFISIFGTDKKVIREVFERINAEDFKLIFKEFGLKHYDGQGSPPDDFRGGILDFTGLAKEQNLVFWLDAEINSFFDKSLRKLVKEKVEQAGFVFA